eukprot:3546173-Prymnesium_polylepis.1
MGWMRTEGGKGVQTHGAMRAWATDAPRAGAVWVAIESRVQSARGGRRRAEAWWLSCLCLNLGGSIGSTGASTIRMTRFVTPLACAPRRHPRVARRVPMYCGSFLSAIARSSEPCALAALALTMASSASRVRSVFSAAVSSSGFCSPSSSSCFATIASFEEWMTFPSCCPTSAMRSYRAFPVASVVNTRTCDDCLPLNVPYQADTAPWGK